MISLGNTYLEADLPELDNRVKKVLSDTYRYM
jgi:hypothetical protein